MITSVRLTNFKNFADETLKLGPFTVIVGANASGKSNIRDAFRFLHGIGRGYSLAEIIGGKIGVGGQLEWEPIRGAPNEIVRMESERRRVRKQFSIATDVELDGAPSRYSVAIGYGPRAAQGFRLIKESLNVDGSNVFEKERGSRVRLNPSIAGGDRMITPSLTQPVLTQVRLRPTSLSSKPEWRNEIFWEPKGVSTIRRRLAAIKFFAFEPGIMQKSSVPGALLGDFGQNLPSALQSICEDANLKNALMAWIRELTPMDVRDFKFPQDPDGNVYLEIVESNNRKFTARSASDGTLRFLSMLAAILNAEANSVYFFEEVDTGLHPARLSLLVDLIERQTKKRKFQVITTTHSPSLLSMISDQTFEHVAVVYRDEDSDDGIIGRVSELPHVRDLRDSQGLARLHSTGWMENVLGFEHDPEEKATPVT